MGLLAFEDDERDPADYRQIRRLVGVVREAGIGSYMPDEGSMSAVDLTDTLKRIADALEHSPVPSTEWRRLASILPPEQLGSLLGISVSSVRRYQNGARETPDDIAARLHLVALVVGDLLGAYNDIGVRRWFDRPRQALGNRRPADLLKGEWKPEDPGPIQVRALARSLVASPAT